MTTEKARDLDDLLVALVDVIVDKNGAQATAASLRALADEIEADSDDDDEAEAEADDDDGE